MANFLKPEKVQRLVSAMADGYGIRTVAKMVGCSWITVRRYWKVEGVRRGRCGCGDLASHNGWCSWRYQRSDLRQAFMCAWDRSRTGSGKVAMRWPYLRDEPTSEYALMMAVNAVVSKELPDEVRADFCQDLVVAVLSGDCAIDSLREYARAKLAAARSVYGQKWGHVSLDYPRFNGNDDRRISDRI